MCYAHRQQHAFDFACGAQTAKERDHTDERRGDDQHVGGAGKQIGAEQFGHVRTIDQRPDAEAEQNGAADLCRLLDGELFSCCMGVWRTVEGLRR